MISCLFVANCSLALVDHFLEFLDADAELAGFGEEGVDALDEDAAFFFAGEGGALGGDAGAGALAGCDEAEGFEFAVGAGDGVWVYEEVFGEGADGGEGLAGFEAFGGDEVFELLDDLQVDGHAVGSGDVDVHGGRAFDCIKTIMQFG